MLGQKLTAAPTKIKKGQVKQISLMPVITAIQCLSILVDLTLAHYPES